jgi:hypothetical protein
MLPELIAALGLFGLVVICPLTMLFLKHQRQMAEILHGKNSGDALQRLESVEREMMTLKAAYHELALRAHEQRPLSLRRGRQG